MSSVPSPCTGPFRDPDGAKMVPIKRTGIEPGQTVSSWLTGSYAPALKPGIHGAGPTASDPAAECGLFSVERIARQSRALLASRGLASLLRRANIQRFTRRNRRLDTISAPRPIGFFAAHRMAATHGWRAWCARRAAQLGSIASTLQSAWRAQRCHTRPDETRGTHFERAGLRASLCEHAIRKRLLSASLARRATSEIRSFRLRAFP